MNIAILSLDVNSLLSYRPTVKKLEDKQPIQFLVRKVNIFYWTFHLLTNL